MYLERSVHVDSFGKELVPLYILQEWRRNDVFSECYVDIYVINEVFCIFFWILKFQVLVAEVADIVSKFALLITLWNFKWANA